MRSCNLIAKSTLIMHNYNTPTYSFVFIYSSMLQRQRTSGLAERLPLVCLYAKQTRKCTGSTKKHSVCECVRVRARVRACVCMYVCVCARALVCVYEIEREMKWRNGLSTLSPILCLLVKSYLQKAPHSRTNGANHHFRRRFFHVNHCEETALVHDAWTINNSINATRNKGKPLSRWRNMY